MPRSLAFVFAHPDDETFAVGGTIVAYTARGVRCDLFCATNGDAGRNSGVPVSSREELGALRRNELISAARILGIQALDMPGHADGALAAADPDVLIGQIVRRLREWRSDIVVTFGPEGGRNLHRDHRAISRAATAAFFLAGIATQYPEQLGEGGLQPHQPSRLYYCAWQPPRPDEELRGTSVPPTAGITVGAEAEAAKRSAFLAHVTQRTLLDRFETAEGPVEWFALAAGTPQPAAMVEDLFAGL